MKPPKLALVPKPSPLTEPSAEQAQRHLALLHPKRDTIALRVLGGTRFDGRPVYRTEGYFDSTDGAASAAVGISREGADAVYALLQPIDPECLHRSVNAWGGKGVAFVSDADVTGYRHLLIDLDPVRPSGVSSTAEELEAALLRADEVRAWLTAQGWPEPLYVLGSGNGAHVVYRIRVAKTPQHVALIRSVLGSLAARWSDDRVKVDTSVHNPSRITKLAGTRARKGTSTRERPHRVAWLERTDERTTPVPVGTLRALAELFVAGGQAKERRAPGGVAELEALLEQRGLAPKGKEWNGKRLYDVRCWRQDHGHRSGYLIVQEPGSDGTGKPAAPTFFARCHVADCDAGTENLLAFLGVAESEAAKFDPDAAKAIVAAVNATGLCELWEGDRALLYVITDKEMGERRPPTEQAVRTFLAQFPRLDNDNGTETHAFGVWTRAAEKRKAFGSTYLTGVPYGEIVGEGPRRLLNRWQGFAYGEGEITARGKALLAAYREHLFAHICAGRRPVSDYLWRLFAWKIQHPTDVPLVAVILTGAQGSGKNTAILPLVNLFGAHGLHTQSPLSKFSADREGKALLYHDEAEFLAAAQVMRSMKALITEQQVTSEAKGVERYQALNLTMHVATSNDSRIYMEPTDRRFLLLRTVAPREAEKWFQKAGLDGLIGKRELERPESVEFHEALLAALRATKLPKGWLPFPAYQTEERREAIEEHLPALEAWVWNALQRGVVPGVRAISPGMVGEEAWKVGRELGSAERQASWQAFRESLLGVAGARTISPARTEGVAGFNSFVGFARRVMALLGAETKVRKVAGKAERVWVLPTLEQARATISAALLERGTGG